MPVAAALRHEPIQPIDPPPPRSAIEQKRIDLGAKLFAEKKLSGPQTIACATCHDLAHGGDDSQPVPVGVHGRNGQLNTLTVFNTEPSVKLFWDGRADSLDDQVDGPIENDDEMDADWPTVIERLGSTGDYRRAFAEAFPDEGLAPRTVRGAIVAYERTLITVDAPFDRYLRGDDSAISAIEKTGYDRFKSYGCISCHQGKSVGGNMFELLGIMGDFFGDRGKPVTMRDLGRFNVTKRPEDRFKFRVPSLRLVTATAPYLHDGSVATLDETVRVMGRYQLGEEIPPSDVQAIVAFLGSLQGTYVPSESHAGR